MKNFTVSLFGAITLMFAINIGMANAAVMQGWILNHANDVDVNNDKAITVDELLGHGRNAIAALDKNKDGKLTEDEWNVGETREERRRYAFSISTVVKQHGWILAHAKQLDIDKDGIITRLELITHAVEAVKALDKNQDAILTGDECPKLATGEAAKGKK
ncbi:MAG: hypothetical protein JRJ23_06985 [Deltaproteobacteria bacterium]|nr:hypothetical protein [Deltaproteobacteria bacterium]MBW1914937.1 hypothetical protein [Deltaproteobacteria bacterium]